MDTGFGHQLKAWRRRQGLSQLALAAKADVSQKHVSFIESGRSVPSAEMVTHLAIVLDVPPREQNRLLVAAGHAARFPESDFTDLAQVKDTLEFMVEAHAPYMAIVVDRSWNVLMSNGPASAFAARLVDPVADGLAPPLNLMYVTFHPDGLRRHMTNWDEAAPILLGLFEREAARHLHDPDLAALIADIRELAGPIAPALPDPTRLLVPIGYEIDGAEIRLFTTIASIGGALDVTVSEILIETFWPADSESDRIWRELFG